MHVASILFAYSIVKPLQPAFAALAIVAFGTPFNTEQFHSASLPTNRSLLQTTQFVIICDGLDYAGNGAGYLTCSGKYGLAGRFFDGYCEGHEGCDTVSLRDGTVRNIGALGQFRHAYDPHRGIAKLNFYGREFTIEDEARLLRINGQAFPLPVAKVFHESPDGPTLDESRLWDITKGRTVILVDAKGKARQGDQSDIDAARKLAERQRIP
jgi:hypothetical protein